MKTAERNFQLLQEIEAGREFLLMAYEQNPLLLKRAEPRIRLLIGDSAVQLVASPAKVAPSQQRGVSLIELIIFIVIISVALIGLLSVMNIVTKGSADPMINKQAMAVADSLLEEVQLQDFVSQSGATTAVTLSDVVSRANTYHIISDYNGSSMTGITSLNGTAAPGLGGYNASVAVVPVALGTVLAPSAVVITVTVTTPAGDTLQSVGYRAAY
jgi:MSHA pilin protein MshD